MSDHLNKMKQSCSQLHLSSYCIKDEKFKFLMLSLLPPSWESFTTAFLGYHEGSANHKHSLMTVKQLVLLIINEECCCINKGISAVAYTIKGKTGGSAQKSNQNLWSSCSYTNHVTTDCKWRGKSPWNICDKFSHTDKECWCNLKNGSKGQVSCRWENQKPDYNHQGKECTKRAKDPDINTNKSD